MNAILQRLALAFVLVFFTVHTVHGKEKERAWQTGKVFDSDLRSRCVGSIGNSTARATAAGKGTASVSGTSSSTAIYGVSQMYVIEVGKYIYVAQERLRWRWSKPADLTVNGPVKVAIEKKKLYLIGDDGTEHEAEIVKKILRQKAR